MTAGNGKRIPLFCLVTALFWFSLYAYVPYVPTYAEQLCASTAMIGLIAGSYGFTQMLLRIPLGIISDTVNRRKIFMLICAGLGIVAALGMYFFPSPAGLLVFRGVSGAAASGWVMFTVLFSSYFKSEESVKATGFLNSFNSLGTMTALLAGGFVASSLGMESTFLLAALFGVAALLLGAFAVENRELKRKPLKLKEIIAMFGDKKLLHISCLAIITQYITFTTAYGFTPVVAKGLGADSFQLGLLSMTITLPGLFAPPLAAAYLVKRWGAGRTVAGCFLLAVVGCVTLPLANNLSALYISQFIGGTGCLAGFSLLTGLSIRDVEPQRRATAMGFFQAVYGIGMFMGPFVSGIVGNWFGLSAAFFLAGLLGVIGMIASKKVN